MFTTKREDTFLRLGENWSLSPEQVEDIFNAALRAGKHSEFHEAAKKLCFDKTIVAHQLIKEAFNSSPEELEKLTNFIRGFLQ